MPTNGQSPRKTKITEMDSKKRKPEQPSNSEEMELVTNTHTHKFPLINSPKHFRRINVIS